MPMSEGQRRDIYTSLEGAHGPDVATNIMELLPRIPHDELATRDDLAANTQVLRGEMAQLGAELRGEMAQLGAELRTEMAQLGAELRGEMAQLGAELRGEMVELRADMRTEMAELRSTLVTEFRTETARLYRWGAALIAANAVTSIAVLLG